MRPLELHVKSPLSDTADDSVEDLSHTSLHILDLLVLDRVTLRLSSYLLLLAAVLALLLKLALCHRATACVVACQEAVHHKVGVATYGRGEMGVVSKGETIVTDVVW